MKKDQYTDYQSFHTHFQQGHNQLVYKITTSDFLTPSLLFSLLDPEQKNCFLLESVEGGRSVGRYSIIGIDPDLIWKYSKDKAYIKQGDSDFTEDSLPPLESLRSQLQKSKLVFDSSLPPMSYGLFGYLGYNFIRQVEDFSYNIKRSIGTEDGLMIRPTILIIFDHVKSLIYFISPVYYSQDNSPESTYKKAFLKIDRIIEKLKAPISLDITAIDNVENKKSLNIKSNLSKEQFFKHVDKAKNYIHEGDIFQVVLSQRFELDFPYSAFQFYRSLKRLNPSPFLFYFNFHDHTVVGSSPEILVRLRDDKVTIKPIAGTRKRGKTEQEDYELSQDLLNDPKERAEHLMLLDLARNDVGKVSTPNSVNVTKKNIIEYYSHVMHIVSNVEGEKKETVDSLDCLLSGFPAGTVSGAPKIRAMEIIDELEPDDRGIYGGAIGYISPNEELDTCIALRTAIIKDNKIYIQAGAGIVADSNPLSEYQETENKAKALISALEEM